MVILNMLNVDGHMNTFIRQTYILGRLGGKADEF